MTGYGRDAFVGESWSHTWEIRSVNCRHLDVRWRTPLAFRSLETAWEKQIRETASRGRLEAFLSVRIQTPELLGVSFNRGQAEAMLAELRGMAADRGDSFAPDYNRFLTLSHLWEDDMREPDPALQESLAQGLDRALADWTSMRESEGAATVQDLQNRLEHLQGLYARIDQLAPDVKEERCQAMESRIRSSLERLDIHADQDRILQETAVLADKMDVSEELARLKTHLERLGEILANGGEAGKRLDFTLQECFREINTCSNKSQDAQVSQLAVAFKAELEKCREQVQNIE